MNDAKWRRNADQMLAAPVVRKRDLKTIAGRVEDRFDAIMNARRRGMSWSDIAGAIAMDEPIKGGSVESAFRRISKDRAIAMPRRRADNLAATQPSVIQKGNPVRPTHSDLFFASRRVDSGDD